MNNSIQDPIPASGDGKDPSQDGKNISQGTQQSNDADPIMADIDAMFGGTDPNQASGDGSGQSGIQAVDKHGVPIAADPAGKQQSQRAFDGMTAEQRATHFQSLYNKLENDYNEMKPDYDKYKNVADFVNQVYEDPKVKEAFLAELAPDLIKPTDPYEALQEQLGKEFGDEFVPDEDEAAKPLSKSWRYFKRVDELYKDLSAQKGTGVPVSLKELRKAREEQVSAANATADKDRVHIMDDMKWSSADWSEFSTWATKLEAKHLARWYTHLRKQKPNAPNLVNQIGGQAPVSIPEVFKDLDNYFG